MSLPAAQYLVGGRRRERAEREEEINNEKLSSWSGWHTEKLAHDKPELNIIDGNHPQLGLG